MLDPQHPTPGDLQIHPEEIKDVVENAL